MSQDKMQISCPICLTFHSSAFAVDYESRRTSVDEMSVEIHYKKYDLWFSVLNTTTAKPGGLLWYEVRSAGM